MHHRLQTWVSCDPAPCRSPKCCICFVRPRNRFLLPWLIQCDLAVALWHVSSERVRLEKFLVSLRWIAIDEQAITSRIRFLSGSRRCIQKLPNVCKMQMWIAQEISTRILKSWFIKASNGSASNNYLCWYICSNNESNQIKILYIYIYLILYFPMNGIIFWNFLRAEQQ